MNKASFSNIMRVVNVVSILAFIYFFNDLADWLGKIFPSLSFLMMGLAAMLLGGAVVMALNVGLYYGLKRLVKSPQPGKK
jgi:hypothetical protein